MSIHRNRVAGVACAFVLAGTIAACSSGHGQPKTQADAEAVRATPQVAPTLASAGSDAPSSGPQRPMKAVAAQTGGSPRRDLDGAEGDDAELIVGREVVARCPTLRLVRQHTSEFDPDTIWLVVLESIAECMSQGGTMSQQAIGVSGDEEHRHVVREVLGVRGVAPTRVLPNVGPGAAECQGGTNCSKRVEITIVTP
jgi:hypothetical protein